MRYCGVWCRRIGICADGAAVNTYCIVIGPCTVCAVCIAARQGINNDAVVERCRIPAHSAGMRARCIAAIDGIQYARRRILHVHIDMVVHRGAVVAARIAAIGLKVAGAGEHARNAEHIVLCRMAKMITIGIDGRIIIGRVSAVDSIRLGRAVMQYRIVAETVQLEDNTLC